MLARFSGFIFLFIFSSTCNCTPTAAILGLKNLDTFFDERSRSVTNSHVFKESMPSVSTRDDLQRLHRVHSEVVHEITFVIRQRNMERLTEMLHDISNPESRNYGQHLTRDQVTDMTINVESRDAVLHYLSTSGLVVKHVSSGGEFVIAEAPITKLEKIFKTEFYHYEMSVESGFNRAYVRAEKYSVPSELDLHVESVLNIIEVPDFSHMPIMNPKLRSTSTSKAARGLRSGSFGTSQLGTLDPGVLKLFYNMSESASGSSKSTQMVYASIKQYFSPYDLKLFQTNTKTTVLAATSVGGHASDIVCITDPSSCAEGNLDIQYVMAMSPGSATTFWYTDSEFTAFLVQVSSYVPLPLVITISYGLDEIYVTKGAGDAFNMLAIKMNILGTTILVSSGDDGANSRKVRGNKVSNCGYMPSFPATSPYVTAVGATAVCCTCFLLN